MIECLMLGDSIAVGTASTRPDCHAVAEVGINSAAFVQRMHGEAVAEVVVISLGANDGPTAATSANLEALRAKVTARSVVWLIPTLGDHARAAVQRVAAEWGDRLVDARRHAPAGQLHPTRTGYQELGDLVR